jgi:hypothetical protein
MSRIFRRVQFTDYLGELRAIDDIYEENVFNQYPTGFTVSNQTTFAAYTNGHYSLVNTDLVGKYQITSPREIECNVGEPQFALFVNDSDPTTTFSMFFISNNLWGFSRANYASYDCDTLASSASSVSLLLQPSGIPVAAYEKIGVLSYPPQEQYFVSPTNLFTITWEYNNS